MALMTLKLGTEVDIATGDELKNASNSLASLIKSDAGKPVHLSVTGSIVGPGVMNIGTPPTGRVWNILTVTLLGSDDTTSPASGKYALYVDADPANLSLVTCRMPALTCPSFQTVANRTLWAHSAGVVALNVGGIAGTQQIICNLSVAEYRASEVTQLFTK